MLQRRNNSNSTKNCLRNLPTDDHKVVTAWINYVQWLIHEFNPIYVNCGVGSNEML